MVEETGGIIEYITVYLASGHQSLERMADWMFCCDHPNNDIAKRSP